MLAIAAVTLLANVATCRAATADSPTARLDRGSVAARGKQSALLTVSAFGRYAVAAASAQGVAIQAVDRMAGAGPLQGEVGKQDGRLDLFLDRGEQKIVIHAAARGSGQVKLKAHAFRELNPRPPLLLEQRQENASLGDFEQRSYWIEIAQKRTVALEAAGRHLADLRLWRDGTWLVDAAPQMMQSQSRPEQPLAVARLTAELPPGLYLLTAYGGPSQPWTEAAEAKPFFLRFGIPVLAPAMRQQFTMGEFGVERFLVPAGPSYFRLELPTAHAATLEVSRYLEHDPFHTGGSTAVIDKRSRLPVAEVAYRDHGERVVTVSLPAGMPYVLQHFDATHTYRFGASGRHWIGTMHAGHADDSVGASAVLTRQFRYSTEEFLAEQAVELDRQSPWHRRFNLLDDLTLFVKIPVAAKVKVEGVGVAAKYRFEPFLTSRPRDYKAPPWRPSGHVFDLDRGLYVLSVTPETRGILDLHLLPPGAKPAAALAAVAAAVRFPGIELDDQHNYTLYLNRQPGVASGVVLRRLPIDLALPLPVSQQPGETLTIPVSVPERGSLRAHGEDGRALEIGLDDGRKGTAIAVEPGPYQVTVNSGKAALSYSLGLEPKRLSSSTPLPPLPEARLAGLPKFPVVTPEAPRYLDLKRLSAETYSVRVDKPGLYQFETTGLLHTGGKVRTRINPALFEESGNGVGRNFQIQRYLREGDYQLGVTTLGETQGHLGVQLARTDVIDGGELRLGDVARALLPSGQALAYGFRIPQRGRYRLQTLGLGRNFDLRLEDADGWPLAAPAQAGDLTQEFEPGNYRVLVLPQTAEARVLTRLDRIADPRRHQGHGPHRIALDTPVAHTWQEPAKGGARTPDQWEFVLPAAAAVTISLDNEMTANLVSTAAPGRAIAGIDARQAWRGELAAGRYLLRAQHSRKNNYVAYNIQVAVAQLVAGLSRSIAVPATLPVAVGADGLVELQSFGPTDVRAHLLDAAGETVAQNDDRPGDWNFHIAQRLAPGQYRLVVAPVAEKHAQTTVSMFAPREVAEKALALGADAEINDAQVHVYPLSPPSDRNVLLVSAKSGDAVGIALEGESGQGWISLGTEVGRSPYLLLPLGAERYKSYRLRAWSADRRSMHMSLRAVAATLAPQTESRWLDDGVTPQRVDDKRPSLKVALIALARPGAFRLKGDPTRQPWSDSASRSVQGSGNPVIAVTGKSLWLAVDDKESAVLAAERLRLPTGDKDALRLELMPGQVGQIDLQPHAQGPALVLAQARAGQPGVLLGDARDPAAMGLVPGEAIAVALPGTAKPVRVWNAASATAALELDLRQVTMQAAPAATLGFGISDGTLARHGALPLGLPGGSVQVRLTLSPANGAVFVRRGEILSTHWAGDESLHETITADADQLWLLNAGGNAAHYSLEIAPGGGEAPATLKPGELLERNLASAGRLRVAVDLPKADGGDYRLRMRGNATALWQDAGGRIEAGNDIAVRANGVLWLQHRPGALVAWLDEPRGTAPERLGRWLKSLQETTVKPPQTVSLKGKQQVLAFHLERAALLHLRTHVPVVTQYFAPGQPTHTEAHLHGANLNLPAPAGASRLVLRAVGADSLAGSATVLTTPAVALGDGAGPEVLLAPGSARLFSFELKQPATVGIGVRASADVVRSVLYDERGAVQAEGVVQMPALAAGRYYLLVEMPTDAAPVRVQAIVLGLKQPDTRPPHDILSRFVAAKESAPALIYTPPPPEPPPAAPAADAPDTGESMEAEGAPGPDEEKEE